MGEKGASLNECIFYLHLFCYPNTLGKMGTRHQLPICLPFVSMFASKKPTDDVPSLALGPEGEAVPGRTQKVQVLEGDSVEGFLAPVCFK